MSSASEDESNGGDPRLPNGGELIDGKYRLAGTLGRGGMGVVFAARHELLQQEVAIKFLVPDLMQAAHSVARFFNEARATARIKSDHVCRVLDFGVLASGSPYLVMEKLDGQDLSQLIKARGPMPIQQAVDYAMQGLEAIAEAHALGIVHRDLKPANLFVARRPDGSTRIKVLDFGVSKIARTEPGPSLTTTAAPLGSPAYMSPEQVRDPKTVDGRTDLWSMGVILYEMLVGRSPFTGSTLGEIYAEILEREIKPVRTHRPDAPPELEEALSRCLRRDRDERFRDAGELAAALVDAGSSQAAVSLERIRGVIRGGPAPAPSKPIGHAVPPSKPIGHAVPSVTAPVPARVTWWRRGVILGLVALVAAALGVVMVRRSHRLTPGEARAPVTPPAPTALPAVGREPALAPAPVLPSAPPPAAARPEGRGGPAQPPSATPGRRRPAVKGGGRPQATPRKPEPPARPGGILDDRQ